MSIYILFFCDNEIFDIFKINDYLCLLTILSMSLSFVFNPSLYALATNRINGHTA